jgi:hypothetical protein
MIFWAHVRALEVAHERADQIVPVVDLVGGQVLEPCPSRVAEVQGQVADDDLVAGGPAQLASQAVVVEPHAGVRLPVVLDDGRGLAEALGERRFADLPAEHTGPWGLRRRGAVLAAVVASAPSRVVAHRRSCVRPARASGVDDVAGVAIQRPACVKEPLLGRRASWVGGSPRRPSRVDRGFAPRCGFVVPRIPLLADA